MAELMKNQLHRVEIESCASDGMGIAHIDGRVVFVARAAVGDVCEVRILKVNAKVAWAKIERFFEKSPQRVEPACPHFGKCGGCDWQHVSYAAEKEIKRKYVEDCLRRIGGCDITVDEIIGAENSEHYRNKAQYPVSDGKVGFYRERTHEVVDVKTCLIQNKTADAVAEAVRKWMKENSVQAYDEKTEKGIVRNVYVRCAKSGDALVCLVANADKLPKTKELIDCILDAAGETVGIVLNINKKKTNVILGDKYRLLWGRDYLMDTLCGLDFKLSVPSFYQVNHDQAERLYAKAAEFAELEGGETVLDLYCGTGTITLFLSKFANKIIGAEIVPEAIEDAKENALRNGIENAEFFCGDASDIAKKFADDNMRPDVIVVDPPRKGLAENVVESIAKMSPRRVVYVSCDAATLARDIKRFAKLGYQIKRAAAADLFPRTRHCESVVRLDRV